MRQYYSVCQPKEGRCADTSSHDNRGDREDEKLKHGSRLLTAMSDEDSLAGPETSTYGCPVCRKEHLLNLDKLQVALFHT